jgi:AraC-like DNA-binding protein
MSGFTQSVLLGCSVFMHRRHRTYSFQRVFAAVLVLHSFGFFNNFVVLACSELPFPEFLNTLLLLFDYLIVGGYMIFAVSLIFPNRYSIRRLLLIEVPFLVFMLLFAITQSPLIVHITQLFTLLASTVLLIWLNLSVRKHMDMLRNNVGDLEYYDLRWFSVLIGILFVTQLLWSIESISQETWFTSPVSYKNLLFDTLWCFFIIFFALYVMRKIIHQKVFRIAPEVCIEKEAETEMDSDLVRAPYYGALAEKNIDLTIAEKRYYLDKSLTLQKLATHLGTNRQYLSNYINQEKHTTFYDYINDLRLEEAKRLLDLKGLDRPYSMEEIADMSGFNSYATFLRSFSKKYGQTPSKYLKKNKGEL